MCGSAETHVFLRRAGVPVHQNILLAAAEAARALPRGDLAFAVCGGCGFVFNSAFDAALLDYGRRYENTQLCSGSFQRHVEAQVERLLNEEGVRHCRIVEVGCGKGRFLRKLVEPAEADNTAIGFDPSYLGPASDLGGRLRFRTCCYDEHCLDEPADVVISRHVIEHLQDPVGLLRTIRRALAGTTKPKIFIETPCVQWILAGRVVWDFFYEHCSLFTGFSLSAALAAAGLHARSVSHVFSGQYLWVQAGAAAEPTTEESDGSALAALADEYADCEQQIVAQWRRKVARLATGGRVAIWGAGAKGVTLANLVDPEARIVDCLIDINPAKQGHFVPGTGHPIVGSDRIAQRGVTGIIVTNPNYRAEIAALIDEAGIDAHLVE